LNIASNPQVLWQLALQYLQYPEKSESDSGLINKEAKGGVALVIAPAELHGGKRQRKGAQKKPSTDKIHKEAEQPSS